MVLFVFVAEGDVQASAAWISCAMSPSLSAIAWIWSVVTGDSFFRLTAGGTSSFFCTASLSCCAALIH
ncbi:hypothetical protein CP978_27670 [Streptomyces nodosus]|uniref:Uncharacterized protein n=1 Tax=Streptomyces nodosus TaxID=40318 RepID=A0A0B5DPW7_9ACTN|nr:hypothetical protein SNOD_27385 [Streptomyces nodosus]QEV41835.1 hypothetical protein CP978_27670 [Streptomyces nodosus]